MGLPEEPCLWGTNFVSEEELAAKKAKAKAGKGGKAAASPAAAPVMADPEAPPQARAA